MIKEFNEKYAIAKNLKFVAVMATIIGTVTVASNIKQQSLQKDSIENSAKIMKILQDKDFVKDVMKSNDYANIAVILEHQSPSERIKSKNQFTDQEKQIINDKINEFENNHTVFKIQENQLSLEYNQTHVDKNLDLNKDNGEIQHG